ncbi:MAG: 2OG-Fe(II) oxygenase [Gammaproteobacteria bacterium]|nr:2OG-Fe(II) oxygenase [Gammaproteobacteria bacterium]
MQVIDFNRLISEKEELKEKFLSQKPFRYLIIDHFLKTDEAEKILREYPPVNQKEWVDSNGEHSKKKWAQPCVEGSVATDFYREVNSVDFLNFIGEITGIPELLADHNLTGAGYHQILDGGFLNVHIDFNRYNGLERRLNLIVYLNQGWEEEYGGYLELWDMETKTRVENIAPTFNRCVIFETNETSYHGHPVPLKTKGKTTRKSLSTYYYTKNRTDIEPAPTHTTIFIHTRGLASIISSKLRYLGQRIKKSALKRLTARK